jgi:aspartate racemase
VLLFCALVRNNPLGRAGEDEEPDGRVPETASLRRHRGRNTRAALILAQGIPYAAKKLSGLLQHWGRVTRRKTRNAWRELICQWYFCQRRPLTGNMIELRFLRTSSAMVRRYRPGVYDGSAVLFRAMDEEDALPLWRGLALEGLIVHDMPGGHMGMLHEPSVQMLAEIVRTQLNLSETPQPLVAIAG